MTTLSRIDKIAKSYTPPATITLGGTIPGADVALLPVRTGPTAATVWTATSYANGQATITLAGPEADSSGALVVTGDGDLWMRVTEAPYVQAVKVERITLLGGSGTVTAPPSPYVNSVQGRTGAVVLSASDVGADASGAASAAQSAASTDATTKANAAQAYAIQRANHTGTQTASTISDLGTAVAADATVRAAYEAHISRGSATTGQVPVLQGDGSLAFGAPGGAVSSVVGQTGAVTAAQIAADPASVIMAKINRSLRNKIRPNQGIAIDLSGTTYRLWQRLSPGHWLGTYLDVRTNANGGPVNFINQNIVVTPSILVVKGDASITQAGTWTDGSPWRWSATSGDTQTWTSPANTTRVGVQYSRLTNGGLSKVSINGDLSRARGLLSAQDLIERGLYPSTILVANGGTLQPTDRVIDHYWSGGSSQSPNVLLAEDLPPTSTGHVVVFTATGYKQAASGGARSYFCGFLHGQAQVVGDATATNLPVLTLDPGAGSSATEYAVSAKPTAGGSNTFMGCIHDNEAQDSLSVAVDGTTTTLTAGAAPVFPTNQVVITKTSHLLHPSATGSVANITTNYILTRDGLTVDVNLVWQQSMSVAAAYSMLPLNGPLQVTGSAVRAMFDRGDLLENAAGPLRLNLSTDTFLGTSKSGAAWMWDSMGRMAAGFYLDDVLGYTNNWAAASGNYYASIEDRNGTMSKAYISRVGSGATTETVANGTTWAWRAHYLFGLMDNPERVFAA